MKPLETKSKGLFILYNKFAGIVFLLLFISISFNLYLLNKSNKITNEVWKLKTDLENTIYEKNRLRNFSFDLLSPPIMPTLSLSGENIVQNSEYHLSYDCPVEWTCNISKDGLVNLDDPTYYGKTDFIVSTLDKETLNNPNYESVTDWYVGLLKRDGKSIGENLDDYYGAVSVPGTDGYIFPFYRSYDLMDMKLYTFGTYPGLIVPSASTTSVDFLIPLNSRFYRFILGTTSQTSVEQVAQFLSIVGFEP